jgi:DNA-binding FadR family transcriptional regulator
VSDRAEVAEPGGGGRTDGIADLLRDDILSGRYGVGDLLPSERELARHLGANRTTIREGLNRLEQLGLIERRQGAREGLNRLEQLGLIERRQGARGRVLDFRRSGSIELVPDLIRLAAREPDAAEISPAASTNEVVRIVYEGAVELAIARIRPVELDALRALVDDLEAAVDRGDVDEIAAADRSFHRAVAQATHSVALELLVGNFYRALDEVLDEAGGVSRHVARSLVALAARGTTFPQRRLLDAIVAGDVDAARLVVRRMMDAVASPPTRTRRSGPTTV